MNRQKNVQQQIEERKQYFLNEAKYWRKKGLPIALQQLLISKNIDIATIIVFDYDQDCPWIPTTDSGKIVTKDGIFYSFSADLNDNRTEIIDFEEFKDITNQYKINGNEKGIGKTDGFLILEVLAELNA